MKFTLLASAFTLSSVLASKGPHDHNPRPVVTVYRTETTAKYGRFNKTPKPTTTTIVVSPSEYSAIKEEQIRSSASANDILRVQIEKRATNETNGSSTHSSANAAMGSSTGVSFAVAGAIAAGCALLM
ncbi:hypothetical protein KGF56_003893 [Candida oxycetoniae]|uniref:Uncharacterized protein n=1 Tax=Candida oxycetoniae TaxID=497107 RepID=A0AAI9SV92_9ASCO|nr:uncharacterized protein KGF56_003893 [Candida oxycetoniae]KAI3403305.1 hypothetical protein KGF56_003893 [Candida oxycetoniae]